MGRPIEQKRPLQVAVPRWVRTVTGLLAAVELVIGLWAYLAPRSFYRDVPTVSLDPPFNQHLMSDFGGMSVALGLILAVAAVTLDRLLLAAALSGLALFGVLHLIYHASHLHGFSATEAAELLAGLALEVLIPVAIVITLRRRTP
jgi:hypothetical protein